MRELRELCAHIRHHNSSRGGRLAAASQWWHIHLIGLALVAGWPGRVLAPVALSADNILIWASCYQRLVYAGQLRADWCLLDAEVNAYRVIE